MVKSELWKLQLDNIKVYLNNNGLNVDKVIRWQGGFAHGGTNGLTIITTVMWVRKKVFSRLALTDNEVLQF
jgi:hypothetical protein